MQAYRLILFMAIVALGTPPAIAQLPLPTEVPPSKLILPQGSNPEQAPGKSKYSILEPAPEPKEPLPSLVTTTPAENLIGSNGLGSAPSQRTWGNVGFRGFYAGEKEAPNSLRYHPIFALDLTLNVALTQDRSVYLFMATRFWGQSAQDGVGNPTQGKFDFSKRQWDFDIGGAWNYYDALEIRAFAYSRNNLNRGKWLDQSYGYNDGVGIEQRYYFPGTDFDRGFYNYIGIGYYPSKDMTDLSGNTFHPGAFLSGSINLPVYEDMVYVYGIAELTCLQPVTAKLFYMDAGVAFRPFPATTNFEIRSGAENTWDIQNKVWLPIWYLGVRLAF